MWQLWKRLVIITTYHNPRIIFRAASSCSQQFNVLWCYLLICWINLFFPLIEVWENWNLSWFFIRSGVVLHRSMNCRSKVEAICAEWISPPRFIGKLFPENMSSLSLSRKLEARHLRNSKSRMPDSPLAHIAKYSRTTFFSPVLPSSFRDFHNFVRRLNLRQWLSSEPRILSIHDPWHCLKSFSQLLPQPPKGSFHRLSFSGCDTPSLPATNFHFHSIVSLRP